MSSLLAHIFLEASVISELTFSRSAGHGNLVGVIVVVHVVIVVAEIVSVDDLRAAQLVKVVVLNIVFISVLLLIRVDLLSMSPSRSDTGATILLGT